MQRNRRAKNAKSKGFWLTNSEFYSSGEEIMRGNYLLLFIVLLLFALSAACGGKSELTGEVVPIEDVCSIDRTKPVAVEGYIEPKTMRCERAANKKGSGMAGCTFRMYEDAGQMGASLLVYISASNWLSAKNNRIEKPESYTGDLQFYDGKGKPLPKKDLRIYDNDGNLIPPASKIRVYSLLSNSDKCEFRPVERIERIS
jgi:hypothetical protein